MKADSRIMTSKSHKIFFGWWQTLITCTCGGLAGGFHGLGISVFFKPIASDLGISRAAVSLAASVGRIEGGFESPLTGWLVDKYGPRWVIFTGACIACIGLALMNFVNSLWQYILVWGIIVGTGHNLGFSLAIDKSITLWFVKKRGLAFSMRFVLTGILGVIVLPIITWLVTTQGWRMTNLIWAGVIFAFLPLLWFFVKQNRPEYYGLLPDGAKTEAGPEADREAMIDKGVAYASSIGEMEFTLRQALKTRALWLLVVGWAAGSIATGGITIHLIPFLTDMGIDPIAASGMMAMMAFFYIPSRFLAGFLGDRVRTDHLRFLLAGLFLIVAVAITAFLLNQTIAMVYVFLILYGFGSGAGIVVRILILARYFGRKAHGMIHGTTNMLGTPLGFLAPVYSGWVYDTTGSYTNAFITFAVLATVGAFLICLVRPPKAPAEVTDVRKFM
jgi:MFS family permease